MKGILKIIGWGLFSLFGAGMAVRTYRETQAPVELGEESDNSPADTAVLDVEVNTN